MDLAGTWIMGLHRSGVPSGMKIKKAVVRWRGFDS